MCDAKAFLDGKLEFKHKKKACDSQDIALTIQETRRGRGTETFDICVDCWIKIADSDLEWSS